jgi:hypothetical protein
MFAIEIFPSNYRHKSQVTSLYVRLYPFEWCALRGSEEGLHMV